MRRAIISKLGALTMCFALVTPATSTFSFPAGPSAFPLVQDPVFLSLQNIANLDKGKYSGRSAGIFEYHACKPLTVGEWAIRAVILVVLLGAIFGCTAAVQAKTSAFS